MRLSKKADYGVRALLDLTQRYGQGPIQSADIAARQGIPEPYLDQLLTILRKAGIIKSTRGPQGGHALNRPPSNINLAEVIATLEGSIAPIGCVEDAESCPQVKDCVQREVWVTIKEATQKVLNATTIGELAERQRRSQGRGMYYI
ncbi:MAG: Rrf2 family transcriptional regulator [Chloroflexi bacterium]|nr:Rrf2 family transcriptional regulator [Chloroflexota bacterium]